MPTRITCLDLDCGMPLLIEENEGVQSIGITWLLPLGSSCDEADRLGAATCLSEWIWRGCGTLNSRAYSEALDRVGIQRFGQVETNHLRIGFSLVASRLEEALPLLVDLVRRPQIEDESFEAIRDLSLQALAGLADDPQDRSMYLVKERHFPAPFNRSGLGDAQHLKAMGPDEVRQLWHARAKPGGSILALSGNMNANNVAQQLNKLLEGWEGTATKPTPEANPAAVYEHEKDETAQVHIALAASAPPEPHEDSILQRVATGVLSGGMSSRLFTEVREKRSLCYSVYASYLAGRDRGAIMAYSGTTPERAQETLDVIVAELKRIRKGATEEEFARTVVGFKSRLIMQGESTSARASAMAHDQYLVGRPRSLEEHAERIDAVTLTNLNDYLARCPLSSFTTVTIGPTSLTPPA